jgi:hypothetical protein
MLDNNNSGSSQDSQQDQRGSLMRVMGLWENTDRRGNKYLSGNLTANVRIMVFRNSYKQEGSRDPDYIVYAAQRAPDERFGGQSGSGQSLQQSGGGASQAPAQPADEDDIPF